MNSYRGLLTVFSMFVLCGLSSFAQESSTTSVTSAIAARGLEVVPRVVTGQPYSAITETEILQTLSDGTHIRRKMAGTRSYRDSLGRTRLERYLPSGPRSSDSPDLASVMIQDPVANVAYFLNPRDHTARQMPFHAPVSEASVDKNSIVTARLQPRTGSATDRPHPKITVEDLGTQVLDGLVVEGKRTTTTFPVDSQGNDKPFDVVTERWFSNELKTYILIKDVDPRSGENTIKTTVTDRSEPAISLFQVPADYTITQQ
jgi:hypothetical protein